MQWAWATSLDQLWHSPAFPMWVTLAAAGFSALVVLIVLLRADKTMANGALAVIALLAIGIASTTTVRGFGGMSRSQDFAIEQPQRISAPQQTASVPALSCLDGLAGDSVEAACERAVFGSADMAAAAVSYAAAQVSRLIAAGNTRSLSPEQQLLKRTIERDRYGLVAQVITARERCNAVDCPLFRVLSDSTQIKANMSEHLYDTLVARYAASWNSAATSAPSPAAGLLPGMPTGKPTTVDFATSTSIPPVSIMTPEPSPPPAKQAAPAPAQKGTNAQAQAKRPAASHQQPAATAGSTAHPPAASVGRPRVVAPVPFMPQQEAN
ncbi:hypothetical protein X566_22605 [Afipia sp. P52-10]|jgi:hypothetical protein|uniref:hypothetical protein n=1 Tax=Afipia sp. P52-10 TaxID=1429916 RepID=UPI0003DF4071|nr:hypothetical protein [Afipia sp. P52-10]ETR75497.1 hypothetical protein X566_22605 [Afipia sp. P52-10]